MDADVVVVGAGLAGLVAAAEAADGGARVVVLDQEPEASLGGQAWWSFGGVFLVDTPEQRRMGVRDSLDTARRDWMGTAAFDRDSDHWPRRWAEAYLDFAAGEKRSWLRRQGVRFFPVVGWAERGDGRARGHGNSVPRFHIVWGTGPGLVAPFERRVRAHVEAGRVELRFRHRVDRLGMTGGAVTGVAGSRLVPSSVTRGEASSREVAGEFELSAPAVLVTSGGIGGDLDLVRASWPARLGPPPQRMVAGVPASVDGRMLAISTRAGASLINADRMWHYTEGLQNYDPVWADHGIRILPGPSSLWVDATGSRLPDPCYPGFDTLATLAHLRGTGHDHSWFVLTDRIAEKELALSGSEQNPDLTGRNLALLSQRLRPGPTAPVRAFLDHGLDVVRAEGVSELTAAMNTLQGEDLVVPDVLHQALQERDAAIGDPTSTDPQGVGVRRARGYLGDRLMRVATPHRLLDPDAGGLIAIRLHLLSRKTLGGLETDLDGRVLRPGGEVLPGLWAAGEVSGFGGGGMHGYSSLEGTFLGGCLFSGRQAGRSVAASV
ncbi:FAD-binding dehydrogenase [Auraticoccus monumenti]|uniref:FAD-binding dehydrogenase n=1 Tax=Auraticoccus monumenti TaxID=675864 RepID=UPI001E5E2CAC|nr:FAD-binding dehydrogenase [Auraticoccus monumenti]